MFFLLIALACDNLVTPEEFQTCQAACEPYGGLEYIITDTSNCRCVDGTLICPSRRK